MELKRKAVLFDNMIKGLKELFYAEYLYELLLRSFNMTDDEIKECGIKFDDNDWQTTTIFIEAMRSTTAQNNDVPSQHFKLKDIIHMPLPENTFLQHDVQNIGFLPVGGLSDTDFSPAMMKSWTDVLDADVLRIFSGAYGMHIELSNVEPERLSSFLSAITIHSSSSIDNCINQQM